MRPGAPGPRTKVAPVEIEELPEEHPSRIGPYAVVNVVGHGGMGTVYQVYDDSRELTLALKLLRSQHGPRTLDKLRFEREFQLIAELDHPALVKVFDTGEFRHRPYYTMEFVAGQTLRAYAGSSPELSWPQQLGRILSAGRQLLAALSFIHSQGIMHRDLKPENVLIQADGSLRLLDFGLARGVNHPDEERLTEPGFVFGTVHYMSPEQVTGSELDFRTDLYSVGVIFYELLRGQLPFDGPEPLTVLFHILHQPPPPLQARGPLPNGLENLVMQLLSKEAADRPWSAAEALQLWEQFSVPGTSEPLAVELPTLSPSGALRDEVLAARLVGRETVLQSFSTSFAALHGRQQGSVQLLQGAAGMGKTRVVQTALGEARSYGLSQVQSAALENGGVPYQLWLRVARWAGKVLREGVPPALSPFRKALSLLVPELFTAPGAESAPEGPQEDDPLQRYHLFEGLIRLIVAAAERQKGAVVVLEDLQWADPASLELLEYLLQTRSGDEGPPLCLILTVRDEELSERPELQLLLKMVGSSQQLQPLSEEQVQQVLQSMLGGAPPDPSTVQKIHLETEGNPLFLTELVRALVAEGRLVQREARWRIDTGALPRTSLGGSRIPVTMREAICRRLQGLSEEALGVVQLAAILGVEFQFDVLQRTLRMDERKLLDHLCTLARRRVLVERQEFSFANQTTLDVVLERLTLDHQQKLHLRVARVLEEMLPKQRPEQRMGRLRLLAHHWLCAGELGKAAYYLMEAARQSRLAYAFEDAAQLYARILDLPPEVWPAPAARLQEHWADASFCAGEMEASLEKYSWLLDEAAPSDPLERARLLRKIGTCWTHLGNLEEAHRVLRESLERLGVVVVPKQEKRKFGDALKSIGSNLLRTTRPQADTQQPKEILLSCEQLARILYLLQPPGWIQEFFNIIATQLRLHWDHGPQGEQADALTQVFLYGGYISLRRLRWLKAARTFLKGAGRRAMKVQDSVVKAGLLRDSGYILHFSGSVRSSRKFSEEALQIFLRLGDYHGLIYSYMMLNAIYRHQGSLDKALEVALLSREIGERTASLGDLALSFGNLSKTESLRNCCDLAQEHLEAAERCTQRYQTSYVELVYNGARCFLFGARQEWLRAAELSELWVERCQERKELPFYLLEFAAHAARARLELGDEDNVQAAKPMLALMKANCAGQEIWGNVARRLEALLDQREGRRSLALEKLSACASWAELANHPLELYHSHRMLADLLDEEGLGEHHRKEADVAFQRSLG